MTLAYTMLYTVYPYVCLTVFVVGHGYRYVTDRYRWNARSSEFLEKRSLLWGSVIFHAGIVLTFVGHAGGLLIPQRIFDVFGIDARSHLAIAFWMGLAVGLAAFVGCLLLLVRRLRNRRVQAAGTANDVVTLAGLLVVIGLGLFNVLFGHYNVLYTLAPWIRGIVFFTPDAGLMQPVPFFYKLHVLAAWALLAYSPFSRLVHIWSLPVIYAVRRWIVFRRAPGRQVVSTVDFEGLTPEGRKS